MTLREMDSAGRAVNGNHQRVKPGKFLDKKRTNLALVGPVLLRKNWKESAGFSLFRGFQDVDSAVVSLQTRWCRNCLMFLRF